MPAFDEQLVKNADKSKTRIGVHLCLIRVDFGSSLGSFWEPNGIINQCKIRLDLERPLDASRVGFGRPRPWTGSGKNNFSRGGMRGLHVVKNSARTRQPDSGSRGPKSSFSGNNWSIPKITKKIGAFQ